MLQLRSHCLKQPNASSSRSHWSTFYPKTFNFCLVKSRASVAAVHTHLLILGLLHAKRCEITALQQWLPYWLFVQVVEDVQITQLNGTEKLGHWNDCTVLSSKQEIVSRFKISFQLNISQTMHAWLPVPRPSRAEANLSASSYLNACNTSNLPRISCWNIQGHNKNVFTSSASAWFQRLVNNLQNWSEMRRFEEQWNWPT